MVTWEVLWFSENFLMILGIKLESLALLLVNLMRKSQEFTQKLNHFYHGLRANWNRDFVSFYNFSLILITYMILYYIQIIKSYPNLFH